MKTKALLATLIGAVAINGATAGEWCPPAPDKCPVECCCDETSGSVSFGYISDYIFYGNRLAGDSIWADANYTFELPGVCLPLTIGVWHLSSLSSGTAGTDQYGDETDLYASVGLPSFAGVDASIGYTHYFFPTTRQPNGIVGGNGLGDSTSEVNLTLSKEVFCGVTLSYRLAYDFVIPGGQNLGGTGPNGQNTDNGAWVHDLGVSKSVSLTDCIGVDLSGGVIYTDNYWANGVYDQAGTTRASGWNNYYLKAAMPIALSGCATLTPFIGYSGSPDTWVADGLQGFGGPQNANANDVFHGGVSISVGF